MEDTSGASTDGVTGPPFSELISRWLEEGDRLSEELAVAKTATPSRAAGSLRQALLRLQPVFDRYRLHFLVATGLLVLGLFMATHRAPPPTVAVASVAVVPIAPSAPIAPIAPPAAITTVPERAPPQTVASAERAAKPVVHRPSHRHRLHRSPDHHHPRGRRAGPISSQARR